MKQYNNKTKTVTKLRNATLATIIGFLGFANIGIAMNEKQLVTVNRKHSWKINGSSFYISNKKNIWSLSKRNY